VGSPGDLDLAASPTGGRTATLSAFGEVLGDVRVDSFSGVFSDSASEALSLSIDSESLAVVSEAVYKGQRLDHSLDAGEPGPTQLWKLSGACMTDIASSLPV
jgi:hypothetical protein